MNKHFAIFLGMVAFIAVFAVVVMVHVPRWVADANMEAMVSGMTDVSLARTELGFSELPDGSGGINVEAIAYTPEMGFDKEASLQAFQETAYPILRENCAGCHSVGRHRAKPVCRHQVHQA